MQIIRIEGLLNICQTFPTLSLKVDWPPEDCILSIFQGKSHCNFYERQKEAQENFDFAVFFFSPLSYQPASHCCFFDVK